MEMSEADRGAASPRTILRSDMRDTDRAGVSGIKCAIPVVGIAENRSGQFDARPVIILSFSSTQEQETQYKESSVSINLSNIFLNVTPGVPWTEALRSVMSSPATVSSLFLRTEI